MDIGLFKYLVDTAGIIGAFTSVALVFIWREWRKEAAAKDALYAAYIDRLVGLIGDYHEFAHSLERYVQIREAEARGRGTSGKDAGA